MDGTLGRAGTSDLHFDGHVLGFIWCSPPHPDQLGISVWVEYIVDRIDYPVDMKAHGDRVVRVTLSAADFYRGDDFCVGSVLIVLGGDDRRFRLLLKPYNPTPQRGLDG